MPAGRAWNANIIDLVAAAKAHCLVVVLSTFMKGAGSIKDARCAAAMQRMVALFSLHHISAASSDLLRAGFLSSKQVRTPMC